MEEVEPAAEVQVWGIQEVEEITEPVGVRAAWPLSLSPGTFQSKMTFCFSRAVAEIE